MPSPHPATASMSWLQGTAVPPATRAPTQFDGPNLRDAVGAHRGLILIEQTTSDPELWLAWLVLG
jgi:hypothetical protein